MTEHPTFHRANLPAHPSNKQQVKAGGVPLTEEDLAALPPWPVINGKRCMPMSGTFMVEAAQGPEGPFTDGFLLIDGAGHPYWQERV